MNRVVINRLTHENDHDRISLFLNKGESTMNNYFISDQFKKKLISVQFKSDETLYRV